MPPIISDLEIKKHCAIMQQIPTHRYDLYLGKSTIKPDKAINMFLNIPNLSNEEKRDLMDEYMVKLNQNNTFKIKEPVFNKYDPDKEVIKQPVSKQLNDELLKMLEEKHTENLELLTEKESDQNTILKQGKQITISSFKNLSRVEQINHLQNIVTHFKRNDLSNDEKDIVKRIENLNHQTKTKTDRVKGFQEALNLSYINPSLNIGHITETFNEQSGDEQPEEIEQLTKETFKGVQKKTQKRRIT